MFGISSFRNARSGLIALSPLLASLLACGVPSAASAQAAKSEKYTVVLQFPLKVGNTAEMFNATGIALDASGNIYVAGSIAGAEEYSPTGQWKRSFGTGHHFSPMPLGGIIHDPGGAMANPAGGRMYTPFGIALDAAGNVYIVDDMTLAILKFASDGSYLGACAIPKKDPSADQQPNIIGIAMDAQGSFYLGDAASESIMKLDGDGTPRADYGSRGSGLGQFNGLRFLTVDGSEIYAVDCHNTRVVMLKTDGTFERTFGGPGTGNGQFTSADGIGVDGNHNVYVADGQRVQKFTKDGTFRTVIDSQLGSSVGTLSGILGIAVSKDGTVYVPDQRHRVIVFKPAP